MTEQEQKNPVVVFKNDLANVMKEGLALPSNVTEDAFRNAAIVAVQDNPQVLDCDRGSVMKSIRTLAAAGLVPDGREAALVPFNTKTKDGWGKKCQAMPMVFGLIKMVRRSGEVKDIRAHIVFQREIDENRFEYLLGDTETLRHEPILFGDKGDPVAAYAVAVLKDGSVVREFMGAEDIDKVRRSGSSQRTREGVSDKPIGIWKQWWDQMWKKTVIRRLCKRLDMSSEDMRHVMNEGDEFKDMRDVTPEPSAFAKKAEEARQQAKPEPEIAQSEDADTPSEQPAQEIEDAITIDTDSEAYTNGMAAFEDGKGRVHPYQEGSKEAAEFEAGYAEASKAGGQA